MYDRILVPLDGSSLPAAALAVASLVPSRLAYLLRVEQNAPEVSHYIGPDGRETHKRIVFREGDEYLKRAGDAFRAQGRRVEEIQSWGDPAERIIDASADVDLIVMATHGRGPARRVLHGSVVDRVAREVSVPVLLVPGEHVPDEPAINRIFVPLDGSELAETAMPVAVTLATGLDLPIHGVCVVDPRTRERSGARDGRADEHAQRTSTFAEHAARIYLEDCLQRHGGAISTTCEAYTGGAIAALLRVIRPDDLVVMTTHGHRGLRRLVLGSVADGLIRRASAPVLLLREGMVAADRSSTPQRAERRP